MGVRTDLADAIGAFLTDPTVTVYSSPVDLPALPCVIVEGADPYVTPRNFQNASNEWMFVIHIMTQRADPESAYTRIEAIRPEVADAVDSISGAQHGPMTAPNPIPYNDIEIVESTLAVSIHTTERT